MGITEKDINPETEKLCPTCNGSVLMVDNLSPRTGDVKFRENIYTCTECKGTGKVPKDYK